MAQSTIAQGTSITPNAASCRPNPTAHRVLYATIGALLVLAVLVAAGLHLPRRYRALASQEIEAPVERGRGVTAGLPALHKPDAAGAPGVDASALPRREAAAGAASAETTNDSERTAAAATAHVHRTDSNRVIPTNKATVARPGVAATDRQPVEPFPTTLAPARSATRPRQEAAAPVLERSREVSSSPSGAGSAASAASASRDSEELERLEQQSDRLAGRAGAVSESLNRLKQSQAGRGLGLRGDIVSSQERMQTYMARAQSALKEQDAKNARKYLMLTETEVENLEKYLGR